MRLCSMALANCALLWAFKSNSCNVCNRKSHVKTELWKGALEGQARHKRRLLVLKVSSTAWKLAQTSALGSDFSWLSTMKSGSKACTALVSSFESRDRIVVRHGLHNLSANPPPRAVLTDLVTTARLKRLPAWKLSCLRPQLPAPVRFLPLRIRLKVLEPCMTHRNSGIPGLAWGSPSARMGEGQGSE